MFASVCSFGSDVLLSFSLGSWTEPNYPHKCFNGANLHRFGWFSNRELTWSPQDGGTTFRLASFIHYERTSASEPVLLNLGGSKYFVHYNKKALHNYETEAKANQVVITELLSNKKTESIAGIDVGGTYIISNFQGSQDLYVKACRTETGSSGIEIIVVSIALDRDACNAPPTTPSPPVSSPVSSPTNDDRDSGGDQCFSAVNTVEVQGKGLVTMDELQIGDVVRDSEDSFSRVYSFGHIDRAMVSGFVQIFADNDTVLETTDSHLLFLQGAQPAVVRAKEIKVGDMLLGGQKVTDIKTVWRTGVYAPLTYSGKIVVSGVAASNYVALLDANFSPAFQDNVAHIVSSYHRLICYANFEWCTQETYNHRGISNWISALTDYISDLDNRSYAAQMLSAMVIVPAGLLVYIVEQVILARWLILLGFLVLFGVKKQNTKKVKVL